MGVGLVVDGDAVSQHVEDLAGHAGGGGGGRRGALLLGGGRLRRRSLEGVSPIAGHLVVLGGGASLAYLPPVVLLCGAVVLWV